MSQFAAELRRAGLPIGPAAVLDCARAAQLLPAGDLYWAGRTTLVRSPAELGIYDEVFGRFFGPADDSGGSGASDPPPSGRAGGVEPADMAAGESSAPQEAVGALAAGVEVLRARDFAACTSIELTQLRRLVRDLPIAAPRRRTRRRRPARRGAVDLRRTTRQAIRTAGTAELPARQRRSTKPRRLVFLVDVSGSMTAYTRTLLMFAQAGLRAERNVEVFCFGTRLTRVTHTLRTTDPDHALEFAARAVTDWDGGTRIGASIKAFNDQYGHKGLARGAVVVVCSDGLERDRPELLRHEMARLARLAHGIVWLNPLKGGANYQPLAGGMRAALDSVDVFLSGHNLASLDELTALLPQLRRATGGR